VASVKHYELLREAITARCRPVPIGYLPRDPGFAVPERHLGLHLADEALSSERVIQLADWIESHLDVERLLRLTSDRSAPVVQPVTAPITSPMRARIGIARDAAFCFYYEDNLSLLRGLGAELVEFSPIADRALPPELDGIYLGGGYPELHAPALSANTSMQAALREFAAGDAPVYAECGGFMYLTEAIVDVDGRRWPMAGLFPTSARMQKRLAKLGYVQVETQAGEPWLKSGERARGHEFRYSTIDPMPATIRRVYRDSVEGYRVRSVLGSYVHLHFRSCPAFATRFVEACQQERAVDVGRGLQPAPGGA
jgi:cobyrinic acid a,c-diamide synthase